MIEKNLNVTRLNGRTGATKKLDFILEKIVKDKYQLNNTFMELMWEQVSSIQPLPTATPEEIKRHKESVSILLKYIEDLHANGMFYYRTWGSVRATDPQARRKVGIFRENNGVKSDNNITIKNIDLMPETWTQIVSLSNHEKIIKSLEFMFYTDIALNAKTGVNFTHWQKFHKAHLIKPYELFKIFPKVLRQCLNTDTASRIQMTYEKHLEIHKEITIANNRESLNVGLWLIKNETTLSNLEPFMYEIDMEKNTVTRPKQPKWIENYINSEVNDYNGNPCYGISDRAPYISELFNNVHIDVYALLNKVVPTEHVDSDIASTYLNNQNTRSFYRSAIQRGTRGFNDNDYTNDKRLELMCRFNYAEQIDSVFQITQKINLLKEIANKREIEKAKRTII